jgi:hypothetical protein
MRRVFGQFGVAVTSVVSVVFVIIVFPLLLDKDGFGRAFFLITLGILSISIGYYGRGYWFARMC